MKNVDNDGKHLLEIQYRPLAIRHDKRCMHRSTRPCICRFFVSYMLFSHVVYAFFSCRICCFLLLSMPFSFVVYAVHSCRICLFSCDDVRMACTADWFDGGKSTLGRWRSGAMGHVAGSAEETLSISVLCVMAAILQCFRLKSAKRTLHSRKSCNFVQN